MPEPTLDERIAHLKKHIERNPYSSTLEKEQLEELERQKQKEGNDVKFHK